MKNDKPTGSITWMAKNSVAANLVMLICLIGGFFALSYIKQEVFPEIDLDVVRASVAYPGASPEEVEKGIVKPIEEAIRNLEGVKEIQGEAREGSGTVSVELVEGEDLQKLANQIRDEVERIRTFPEDAEEPRVQIVSRKRQVLDLVIYGDVDRRALHYYSEVVRDDLLRNANITQIEVSGLPAMEIGIQVSQETLRYYNLTIDEIARRVRSSSLELPFGAIKAANGEILLRMTERRDYGRQFAQIPIITNTDGSEITLEEIATINDGFEESDYIATFDGKPAVMLEIFRIGRQTPVEVSAAVNNSLEKLYGVLPKNLNVSILRDRSIIFEQRVDLLLRNAAIGLLLVLVSLGLFLEIRLAFWVMMGIPISFLGSMLILPFTGLSFNMVSLFAYIVALGIVVDDAIVIGENIYQYREKGMSHLDASIAGAKDMAAPITFSILTNIVTFMPLYFMPGRMGKFFWQIPVVVITVFTISLLESLYVLPAHLGHQKSNESTGFLVRFQRIFSSSLMWGVHNIYSPIIRWLLPLRYIALAVSLTILMIIGAWTMSGRMGFQSFPRIESDYSNVNVIMPFGTPISKTFSISEQIVDAAIASRDEIEQKFVKGIFAEVGKDGSHNLRVRTYLVDANSRKKVGISTTEFTNRWRDKSGKITGAEYARFAADSGGPSSGAALTIELSYSDSEVLKKASKELATAISELQYTADVDDGHQKGKEQLDFIVLPEGKALGLTSTQIARQLRNSYLGAEVTRQLRGRNEVKIKVLLAEEERISEHNLEQMIVRTSQGREVMLYEIAMWQRGYAYTAINRRDGRRVVQVTANVEPRGKTLEVLNKIEAEILPRLKKMYPGLISSFQGRQADHRESLSGLTNTFILALFVVYALMAIPFRSYVQPLIIMFAIPFGFVGAILGHLIMGYTLCIPSILGIIALSGVVVNDSLVLVDCVNRLREREQDGSITDTLVSGACQRFRPILFTTITTFCGLMPMIFETSRQAKFLIPMAISLGFGIVFATLITLILVPCLYLVVEDMRALYRKCSQYLE
ncbi:efflux RND transporter permease subunit [Candidatus Uabimicrobium sp. HlEnr_7]|uniref:efflux RND transporter permease subunit n=1 Tax=Candidatus Uabimicrobium helgolandensis TaxID=3095367 RepID=UPI003556CD5E